MAIESPFRGMKTNMRYSVGEMTKKSSTFVIVLETFEACHIERSHLRASVHGDEEDGYRSHERMDEECMTK